MKITDIDKNFAPAEIDGKEFVFIDAHSAPLSLEGFAWKDERFSFSRLPAWMTEADVNSGALWLGRYHTSGGAVRFRSNSPEIAIRATLANSSDMNHMPRCGSAGFDIDCDGEHWGTIQPCRDQVEILASICKNPDGKMHDYVIHFPLYGGVAKFELGIDPAAEIEAPKPHATPKPILFYGSSITQGGCASRPGNNYCWHICRELDAEQINLGFSGSARGEEAMARAIAELDLAAFVYDYDHNAPTLEHLRDTHEKFFKIVRAAHPDLPIIMASLCNIWDNEPGCSANLARRAVIMQTYLNAFNAGDKNVWFVDGTTLFGTEDRTFCTVDRCHPTDLGFYRMYKAFTPTIRASLR